jgi:hypothetical protein
MTTDGLGKPLRLQRGACGFKSCPQDRSAATIASIELLLKGFAGAGFEAVRSRANSWPVSRHFCTIRPRVKNPRRRFPITRDSDALEIRRAGEDARQGDRSLGSSRLSFGLYVKHPRWALPKQTLQLGWVDLRRPVRCVQPDRRSNCVLAF